MARQRLDPGHPDAVVFSTKLGVSDAERIIDLASQDRMGKSEFVRDVLLRELERRDEGPPEPGG